MELKINSELKALIPPLTNDEYRLLEESIISEGCRDKLIVWDDTIIDGHNRYEICKKNGIDFNIEQKDFKDIEEAKDWMDFNQLARRNLTPDQRKIIIGRRYNREKKIRGGTGSNQYVQSDQNDRSAKTSERLAKENNVSAPTVRRYAKDSEFFDNLTSEDPETAESVWSGKEKLSEVKRKAHVSHNSGNNEWYTPLKYIDSARVVMGSIDLDPATSESVNQKINAKNYYTKETDGLEKEWFGNIWLNPPYENGLVSEFIEKICHKEYKQAIVLVNNATETKWGAMALKKCSAVCFHTGRIRFISIDGQVKESPLQGQMILYFGDNVYEFISEFKQYGVCLKGV